MSRMIPKAEVTGANPVGRATIPVRLRPGAFWQ